MIGGTGAGEVGGGVGGSRAADVVKRNSLMTFIEVCRPVDGGVSVDMAVPIGRMESSFCRGLLKHLVLLLAFGQAGLDKETMAGSAVG